MCSGGIIESRDYISRDELATIMGSSLGRNPKRTLKFYEKIGLIPKAVLKRGRQGGVYACYPRAIVNYLEKIKELQAKGLSLREIKDRLECERGKLFMWMDPKCIDARFQSTLFVVYNFMLEHFKDGIDEKDMKVLLFLKREPELYKFILKQAEIMEKLKHGDHPQDHQEE
ncbi:hypothetical protein DRP07_08415 [Archaeoglobales archaeon]|nr:MAG: hypothetical protein DRP07_08415 [Archaeoglobales archaeon]